MKTLIILASFVLLTFLFFCRLDPFFGLFGGKNKENSKAPPPRKTVGFNPPVFKGKDTASPVKVKVRKPVSKQTTSSSSITVLVTKFIDLPGSFGQSDYNSSFGGLKIAAYNFSGLTPAKWVINNRKVLEAKEINVKYNVEITAAVDKYGVDRKVVVALITRESGGIPTATSSAGAVGLTQLMPQTAAYYGVTNRDNPAQSIMGGCHYLSDLIKVFGNTDDALLGYAYGEGGAQRLLKAGYKSANDSYVIMLKAIQAQI